MSTQKINKNFVILAENEIALFCVVGTKTDAKFGESPAPLWHECCQLQVIAVEFSVTVEGNRASKSKCTIKVTCMFKCADLIRRPESARSSAVYRNDCRQTDCDKLTLL